MIKYDAHRLHRIWKDVLMLHNDFRPVISAYHKRETAAT